MSTAVGSHSGSNPLSLMSCVRESSPLQDLGSDAENEKNGKHRNTYIVHVYFIALYTYTKH